MKSVKLRVYDCVDTQASSSSKVDCGSSPVSYITLDRGKTININYDVNSFAALAKFYGKEVGVSYRKQEVRRGVNPQQDIQCDSECFDNEDDVTYYSNLNCNYQSCNGTRKKLRFLFGSSGSGCSTLSITFGVLIGHVLTAIALLF